ncbi:VOC family protein [Brucella sp. BE17]|uniref:VOC family protein n=1 Tax=Brucella sp. BE17 TaxID=3142977 RepID=UPI0031BA38AC
MQATRILETALYVRDIAEAIRFYGDILGLEPVGKSSDRNAFFRCGDGILLLFKAEETLKPPESDALPVPTHGTSGPGHACFAAERTEIENWCAHLQKHGISIESDFEWPNGARSIYIRDPSGNSLEFAEPKLWN